MTEKDTVQRTADLLYEDVRKLKDINEDLLTILQTYLDEWEAAHMYDRIEILAGLIHEPISLQMARVALEAHHGQR